MPKLQKLKYMNMTHHGAADAVKTQLFLTDPALSKVSGLHAQHALAVGVTPGSFTADLVHPLRNGVTPVSSNEDTTDDVDELQEEDNEAVATFLHPQQNGFNIVFNEDAGDTGVSINLFALLCHSVLVCENRAPAD